MDTKNKLPKSEHITEYSAGHNSGRSVHSIQALSEEVWDIELQDSKYSAKTALIAMAFNTKNTISCWTKCMSSCNWHLGLQSTSQSTRPISITNSGIIKSGTNEIGMGSFKCRYIHDHIYPTYFSQDQAKNANGGVWPTDFSKIRLRPGGINYIYNIMTGYHFKAPYGMDVPKGKHLNP